MKAGRIRRTKGIEFVMRFWQRWYNNLQRACQQNPPRVVEAIMLILAIVLLLFLIFTWQGLEQWPYLILSLCYCLGASVSLLVRETHCYGQQPQVTPTAVFMGAIALVLVVSLIALSSLVI